MVQSIPAADLEVNSLLLVTVSWYWMQEQGSLDELDEHNWSMTESHLLYVVNFAACRRAKVYAAPVCMPLQLWLSMYGCLQELADRGVFLFMQT